MLFTILLLQGKGRFKTFWLEGADPNLLQKRLSNSAKKKTVPCHNSGIGEAFQMNLLRKSPITRHTIENNNNNQTVKQTIVQQHAKSAPQSSSLDASPILCRAMAKRDRDTLLQAALLKKRRKESRHSSLEIDLLDLTPSELSGLLKQSLSCPNQSPHLSCPPTTNGSSHVLHSADTEENSKLLSSATSMC